MCLDVLHAAIVSQHVIENHTDFRKRNLRSAFASMDVFENGVNDLFEPCFWIKRVHAAVLGLVCPLEFCIFKCRHGIFITNIMSWVVVYCFAALLFGMACEER